jgi:hypothetical protein
MEHKRSNTAAADRPAARMRSLSLKVLQITPSKHLHAHVFSNLKNEFLEE